MNNQEAISPVKKCKQCGRMLPQAALSCFSCNSYEFEPAELPTTGRVYSYTTIRIPPEGFNNNEPYNVVVVEIEGGARLLALQTRDIEKGLNINDTVELEKGPAGLLAIKTS